MVMMVKSKEYIYISRFVLWNREGEINFGAAASPVWLIAGSGLGRIWVTHTVVCCNARKTQSPNDALTNYTVYG